MKKFWLYYLASFVVSFLILSCWYIIFLFVIGGSFWENIRAIYLSFSFWKGVIIWSLLYYIFIALPIIYLKKQK